MTIAVVEKAFLLLETLAKAPSPVALGMLARRTDLPKPTTHRLLSTLIRLGYVARGSSQGEYTVGTGVARLSAADPVMRLREAAAPLLEKLQQDFNETVNLGLLDGEWVTYVDFRETTKALRLVVRPGARDPFYCTALGRSAASELKDEELRPLLDRAIFQAPTSRSVCNRKGFLRELEATRLRGYAREIEETNEGVACFALSLRPLGFAKAALSVSIPVSRLTAKFESDFVQNCRRRIERAAKTLESV